MPKAPRITLATKICAAMILKDEDIKDAAKPILTSPGGRNIYDRVQVITSNPRVKTIAIPVRICTLLSISKLTMKPPLPRKVLAALHTDYIPCNNDDYLYSFLSLLPFLKPAPLFSLWWLMLA